MRPPPLPKSVWSQLGPVKVRVVKELTPTSPDMMIEDGDFALYNPHKRVIQILRSVEPWARWHSVYHEQMHIVVYDSGLHHVIDEAHVELLCESYATARVGEMRAALEAKK